MRIVLWYQGMDLRSEVYAVVPDLDPDIIGFKIHTEIYTYQKVPEEILPRDIGMRGGGALAIAGNQ